MIYVVLSSNLLLFSRPTIIHNKLYNLHFSVQWKVEIGVMAIIQRKYNIPGSSWYNEYILVYVVRDTYNFSK